MPYDSEAQMELNFKQYGEDGEPLVIMHGLMGSLDNWQAIARQLANDYTVFTLDARNHGKSPDSNEFSLQLMADDLLEFLHERQLFRTRLIGHSMGGKTAMQFALQNPDYIDRLVVADIAPSTYAGGHETIFKALLSVDLDLTRDRNEIDRQLAVHIPDMPVRQFLMKGLRRTSDGFEWKYNLKVLWDKYPEILGFPDSEEQFEDEVLFVKGGNSAYITSEQQPDIDRYFPNARIGTIDGAGHWVHAEAPDAFLEMVRPFLAD